MPEPPRRVALAFMAHPDDAEILCAGTLIRLQERGWEIHIATVANGDLGSVSHPPQQIAAIRETEAQQAAQRLGGIYHGLGEHDGYVCYDKATLGKTYELFRRVAPTLVFTHPSKDYMMDHEMVSQLARAGSFLYAAPHVSQHPIVPGSTLPHLYYCDPIEGVDPLGHPVEPTRRVDVSQQIEQKAELLACHASQREWLRAHHGMDEYIEAMRRWGQKRGEELGCAFAEGFVQHLGHPYPHDDLLGELFG